jgi:ferritin-like metal-binding protein YciE
MKNQNLYQLFINELQDVYSAEGLIIEALPRLIKSAFHKDLKEALTHHLDETRHQVVRLQKVFSLLGLPFTKELCKGMEGILKEGEALISHTSPSAILDAAIIASAQKVEHYEIASYGTLCSFAKHLNLQKEIGKLLDENLQEEGMADKKLTKLAEGSFFSTGINEEAVEDTTLEREALHRS